MICCLFCRCNIIRSSYQRENVPLVAKVWSCTSQNLVVTSENLHDEFFHFTIKQTREGVLTTEYLDVEDRIGCRLCELLMIKNSLLITRKHPEFLLRIERNRKARHTPGFANCRVVLLQQ